MKKFISSLNAKFALALLAVCSVFMTACYEKPEPAPVPEPVPATYYITGTVSDGGTGEALTAGVAVKIAGQAVTLSKGSFKHQVAGAGEYVIDVTAEGYMDVTRTVQVVAVAEGQVSITSVDIALFNANTLPAPTVTYDGGADIEEDQLESMGFGGATVTDANEFKTEAAVEVDAVDHAIEVKVVRNEGFIFQGVATKAIDETAYVARALSQTLGLPFYNNSFKETSETVTVGAEGKTLVGYSVERTFVMENYIIDMYDGTKQTFSAIYEKGFKVVSQFDVHDNHDNHDNHGGGNGGDAVGGGSGNEQ
ncbi:MAG: DUF3869 domain-containing protein [Bacteroidales bacterium]|nr:DUF3869 domain-containing protein [Bacteroidales bacterium]